jgi:type I restriction enzyme S subunit
MTMSDVMVEFHDGPHATPPPADDGPIFLGIRNITESGRLDLSEVRHIAEEDFDRWTRRATPQPGDVVFTYEATLHRYALIPQGFRGCLGRRLALIRPDTSVVLPRYLHFAMLGPLWRATVAERVIAGATVDRIPIIDFPTFPIALPDIETQSRVVEILGALDDLIENNRRRITLVEKTAQAIYREWFVKFRYPGDEDHELVDSPLGPIPAGWEVTTLAEQSASLVDGDWIESKDQGGGDYRLLQVSNIGVGSFRETGNFRYITAQTFERLRCTEIRVGDILISRMPDPIGRAWLVDVLDSPAVTAVDVAILTPRSPESGLFLSHWLNTPETLAHADAVATGTTRKRITRSVLGGLPFAMPPPQHISHFFKTVAPLAEAASTLRRKSASLATMRDLLLPKLVTGAIDVSKVNPDAFLEQSAA